MNTPTTEELARAAARAAEYADIRAALVAYDPTYTDDTAAALAAYGISFTAHEATNQPHHEKTNRQS